LGPRSGLFTGGPAPRLCIGRPYSQALGCTSVAFESTTFLPTNSTKITKIYGKRENPGREESSTRWRRSREISAHFQTAETLFQQFNNEKAIGSIAELSKSCPEVMPN
jgi:hypothetical protein